MFSMLKGPIYSLYNIRSLKVSMV